MGGLGCSVLTVLLPLLWLSFVASECELVWLSVQKDQKATSYRPQRTDLILGPCIGDGFVDLPCNYAVASVAKYGCSSWGSGWQCKSANYKKCEGDDAVMLASSLPLNRGLGKSGVPLWEGAGSARQVPCPGHHGRPSMTKLHSNLASRSRALFHLGGPYMADNTAAATVNQKATATDPLE